MRPKMTAALDALDAGAARIIMANGTRPHARGEALLRHPHDRGRAMSRHFITIEHQTDARPRHDLRAGALAVRR